MATVDKEEVHGAVNMTTDKHVEFQVRLSVAETEATIWSVADIDCTVWQLETEIYSITSNEDMQFKKEFSISLFAFEAWLQAIGIQELQKTIEQRIIHLGYPLMHLVSHT